MMIGSYPYLMNPSGMGGVYAAAVASQPIQPISAVQGQSSSAFIQFGGALSGQSGGATSGGATSGSQTASSSYSPGSTLDITA